MKQLQIRILPLFISLCLTSVILAQIPTNQSSPYPADTPTRINHINFTKNNLVGVKDKKSERIYIPAIYDEVYQGFKYFRTSYQTHTGSICLKMANMGYLIF